MSSVFNLNNLQPCDRVVLPKSGIGFVQHHAIYIGKDSFGNRVYVENAINCGVHMISEAYLFRDGYQLTRVEPFRGSQQQRNIALKEALGLIGTKYDLINFNCEHYANSVQYKRSYSAQVGNGIALGLLAVLFGVGLTR